MKAYQTAEKMGIDVHVGNVLSSDKFYDDDPNSVSKWKKMGVLAVEMEAAALYLNAARHGAEALCVLTVSDHIFKREEVSASERERSFTHMMELTLASI